MGSTECVQGQAEGHRGQPVLVPISEGIPQDILESFGFQEDLNQMSVLEQSTRLYSGEMRKFLPSSLGGLDWSSGERSLSSRLVQSLESGFAIHLRIGLSEEEGDAFLGALGVNKMEEAPVVEMEGTWRLWMQNPSVETSTGLPLDPMVGLGILRDSSSHKMIFRLFLY